MNSRQRLLGAFAAVLALPLFAVPAAHAGDNPPAVTPLGGTPLPAGVSPSSVGGTPASVKDYPFIIAGLREGGSRPLGQTCTGSVVAPRKILIAAHCKAAEGEKSFLYGLDDLSTGGGTAIGVVSYDTHPKYVNFDQGYDVAVVTTDRDIPVPGGQYAKVATSADTDLNKPGKTGLGLGYGKKDFNDDTRDVTLTKFSLPIVAGSNCSGVGAGFQEATMICSGYADGHVTILPGDSGGPLLVDGKVAGVASWSRSDFKWYSVYGRLNNDMGDWVKQQIGDVTPPETFGLGVTPGTVQAEPGKYVSASVTSTAGKNGPEQVDLTAAGLPEGAKATFQPATITSGETAKLTIETSASTPQGNYPVTITGKGASGTATAKLTLTVGSGQPPTGDLKVSVDPGSGTVQPGFFATATVTVSGGTGTVTLSATGLSFAPFFTPSTLNGSGTAQMQVVGPFQRGTYPVTVTAKDSTGKTATAKYTLTVQ
ncbi:secreted trypsin-like serine protease [Amycolatopsis lexingtonensis]|uniref:Secreted trypsin-like serine protease n=1 Tax=Amycolatopsis lexingtonensis TaxID=218822 RepID=A0ABR9HUH8_9PSEU|nr:trypsin-like serine protease [Amycolatopsis lexingtonensis]MBE1494579.1 secreted trypsin-like serine protease [Amycolatopsis lexingtonensis]